MTDKEKRELKDGVVSIFKRFNILDHTSTIGNLRDDILRYIDSLQEEHVSEELDEEIEKYLSALYSGWSESQRKQDYLVEELCIKTARHFTKWQKENIWKPANGDDLPEIDREVIALLDNGKVVFAHRPNPEGWEGKSLSTGKVEHYIPQCYDKGWWNIPNVKYWLDCSMPKEIEL